MQKGKPSQFNSAYNINVEITSTMVYSDRISTENGEYIFQRLVRFVRRLTDEFESTLHDKCIYQRVEDESFNIILILHDAVVVSNQYTFYFIRV